MRLIDADVLKENVPSTSADMFENCRNCRLLDEYQIREIIDNAPTVAAVVVVRCGECKHGRKNAYPYCKSSSMLGDRGYCSMGERVNE